MFQVLPQGQRHRNELNEVISFAELTAFSGVKVSGRDEGRGHAEKARQNKIISTKYEAHSRFSVLSVR